MSNIAQLLISDLEGPPETEDDWNAETKDEFINVPVLESQFTIPVFWLTLFNPGNIHTYIDPDDEIEIPYLFDSVGNVKDRFERRLSELRKFFGNIDSYVPIWRRFLKQIDKKYIKVQLSEILELSDDGYELLEPALNILEELNKETMLAFMRLTDFPYILDQETKSIIEVKLDDGKDTKQFLMGFDPWG